MKIKNTKNTSSVLRKAGLRVTPQRMAVWNYLSTTTSHPTADMVYKALRSDYPGLSLDTVNRTLHTFAENLLAHILPGDGDPRRYDADLTDHYHFRCIGCGQIFDAFDTTPNPLHIPQDLNDFQIVNTSVMYRGYCPACRTDSKQ